MSDVALRPAGQAAPSSPSVPAASRRAGGSDGATRAWRAATAPFWLWSDVPAPDLPGPEPAAPAEIGLAGEVFLAGLDGVRTRLWLRAMIQGAFRGAWLALLGACAWMLWSLLAGGPPLDLRLTGAAMAAGAALGVVVGALSKPSRARTAAMLDRTWALQDRLATSVEGLGRAVPGEGERAAVPYLQMADGANTIEAVKRDPLLSVRPPVREIVLVVFWALALAALVSLRGVGGPPPEVGEGFVPRFVAAAGLPAEPDAAAQNAAASAEGPSVEEVMARAQRSNQARQDLQALASALADHAVTRQAADAIGQGDYERAADELRILAPDAQNLSEGSRGDLSRDLDAAAESMSDGDSGLKPASREAAGGLRDGGRPAQEGLRSLAEAVETAGAQVAPQAELAEQMQAAQQRDPAGSAALQQRLQEEAAARQAAQQAGAAGTAAGQAGDGAAGEGQSASGSSGQPGQSGQGEGQGEGQPGAGERGPESASGAAGGGDAEGDQGEGSGSGAGQGDQQGDAPRSGQGGGAGSGEASGEDAAGNAASDQGSGEEGAAGEAPGAQPVAGDGQRGEAAEGTEGGADTLTLPPGQGGQQGVQTVNDGGSALAGSGTGVTAGAGTATQGEVGESGPDSNHVPPQYRDIVQDYFSDRGGQ